MLADSGNGAHLLYRINLPVNDDNLVKRVLAALAFVFDDDQVRVDQTTYNPARIWKLYGTKACKGDDVPNRPHRFARLLDVPTDRTPVARSLLESLAASTPEDTPRLLPKTKSHDGGTFDLDEWIEDSGIETIGPTPWQGGRKWILPACPWNDDHRDRAAYIVQFSSGAVAAGCHHASCQGLGWRELRTIVEGSSDDPSGSVNCANSVQPFSAFGSTPAGMTDIPWEPPTPIHEYAVPSFPTIALPDWLQDFVEAVAVETQTPPDLAAMLGLTVCSAACAKTVEVVVRKGWAEPVNIYTVVSLPSGNRKSAVFRKMTEPIVKVEAERVEASVIEIAERRNELEILEAQHREAQKRAIHRDSEGFTADVGLAEDYARKIAEFKVPVAPRLLVDDTSPERLSSVLAEQGGRIALMSPEGDIFDIMGGRYSSNNQANFGVFLKGHAGEDLRVDRVNRPAENAERVAITIGLTVQPSVLSGLLRNPSMRGRGLLARFLYSVPPSPVGHREIDVPPVPTSVRECYVDNVRRLLSLKPAQDADGKPVPHALYLEDDALRSILDTMAWLEPQLADGQNLEVVKDWANKLAGAIARIAGILHMAKHVNHPEPWKIRINAETVGKAVTIGTSYLLEHAIGAFGQMGADPVVDDARYVLHRIDRMGAEEFTRRDLFVSCRGRFKKVLDMDPALDLLERHMFIRPLIREAQHSRGRPASPSFEVNPLLNTHKAQNAQNIVRIGPSLEELTGEAIERHRMLPEDRESFSQEPEDNDQRRSRLMREVSAVISGVGFHA